MRSPAAPKFTWGYRQYLNKTIYLIFECALTLTLMNLEQKSHKCLIKRLPQYGWLPDWEASYLEATESGQSSTCKIRRSFYCSIITGTLHSSQVRAITLMSQYGYDRILANFVHSLGRAGVYHRHQGGPGKAGGSETRTYRLQDESQQILCDFIQRVMPIICAKSLNRFTENANGGDF